MFRAVIVHQFISSLCRSVVCIWYWIYHKHITAWPRPWHYLLICAWYWLHLCSLQNNIKQKYKQSKKHYNTISHKTRELDQAWQNNISLVYTFKYLISYNNNKCNLKYMSDRFRNGISMTINLYVMHLTTVNLVWVTVEHMKPNFHIFIKIKLHLSKL